MIVKLKWAFKLLRSKYFVVLTDKESVICIKGASPDSFLDSISLMSQTIELKEFNLMLKELVKEHDEELKKFSRPRGGKRANTTTKRTTKATKRPTKNV